MNIININGYTLNNLNKINILLGKNGCGKSTLLRQVEPRLASQEEYGKTKYITPERGGTLIYEAGIEQGLSGGPDWLPSTRRKNLTPNFRQQSVAQYRRLETLVLREFERDQTQDKFNPYVEKINLLLDNIEIQRHDTAFKIFKKGTTDELKAENISSGESELISLGIECFIFANELTGGKENILFLDEPDVHLHPDLQVRLIHFLVDLIDDNNFKVLIATHSTAILSALEKSDSTGLAFMDFGQKEINFKPISPIYKKILPVFGAHPLSNVFNDVPVLLVEGGDDERIWQQAIRSSVGKIKIYPCAVDSVSNMSDFETEAQQIINTIYESAKGYSLRDSDGGSEEIADILPIIRMKLSCRNAENLLLTDEVLETLDISWIELKGRIEAWLISNKGHNHFDVMQKFKDDGYDRKQTDTKIIRNDLMGLIGSEKSWEIVVGQTIAKLRRTSDIDFTEEGKIFSFLGKKLVDNIIPI